MLCYWSDRLRSQEVWTENLRFAHPSQNRERFWAPPIHRDMGVYGFSVHTSFLLHRSGREELIASSVKGF